MTDPVKTAKSERGKKQAVEQMEDYFQFVVDDPKSKLVTSNFIRGKRVVIRGVGAFVQVKKGKVEVGYSYHCVGSLCRLLEQENVFDVRFNGANWEETPQCEPGNPGTPNDQS